MTASQITENPAVIAARQKLQVTMVYLSELPSEVWRNLLILLASIWICHSLANLFWLIFPTPTPPQPTKLAVVPAKTSAGGGTVVDIDIASLQGLFGKASENAPTEEEQNTAELPPGVGDGAQETRLNLKLMGVIASDQSEHSRAIIDDNKEQLLLKINEELPRNKGVKVARVMPKKVILDNNGKYESLSLYDDSDEPPAKSNSSYKVPRREASAPTDRANKKATVSRDQMPKSISDIVRFSVHRENGQMVGYRIRPGRERELFDQVGLKANDIVTTVNGIRMDDPKQLKTVYQSLKTATSADLGVLRGGEELSIHISVGE